MATAYKIDTYRDPVQLDISNTLGKASTYLQQNYDVNTMQTQQLINQYSNTDLLKDIDKEYLGDRLKSIVNYINESGTRDWSRKNITNEIQSYVSSAIDDKVLNAVASTKSYRKQIEEIENIKKTKPELWSLQNQEFATADLNRYLSSKEVGDKYHARPYTPYTDVQKKILENSKILKDFGVEYHYDEIGGNSWFTRIGKKEKISVESAKEYLNMMMTPELKNQLYIDGWYTYRGKEDSEIKKIYDDQIDANIEYIENRKSELNLELTKPTNKSKKSEIQSQISNLEDFKSNLLDQKKTSFDRSSIVNNLYTNDFIQKNTSFLSYDRLIDSFVDNSGFELAKFNYQMSQDDIKNRLDQQKMQMQSEQEYQKLKLEYNKIGYDLNPDGTVVESPNNPFNQNKIPTRDEPVDGEEKEVENGFIKADKDNVENSKLVNTAVTEEITRIINDPKNAKLLETIGAKAKDPKSLAWGLVNAPSKMGALYDHLSEESKTIIDKTKSTVSALNRVNDELKSIREDSLKALQWFYSDKTKSGAKEALDFANNGYTIDTKGNVVKGSNLNMSRTDNFQKAARLIGTYNLLLMEDLPEDQKLKIKRLISIEAQNIKDENGKKISLEKAQDIISKLTYNENNDNLAEKILVGTFGQLTLGIGKASRWVANKIDPSSDISKQITKEVDLMEKQSNEVTDSYYNRKGLRESYRDRMRDYYTTNNYLRDLAGNDVDTSKSGFAPSEYLERVKNKMVSIDNKLSDYTYTTPKSLNIYLGDDKYKKMIPEIMASLPMGTELQKDSNLKIVVNKQNGTAKIIASIKDGSDYKVETFNDIKIEDLPQQVINSVDLNDKSSIYSATNPNAVKYNKQISIVDNKESFLESIDYLPEKERYEAYKNPPVTQEDIYKKFKEVYGEEIINKYSEEIKNILNSPINIGTEVINDKWSIVARQNNQLIYMSEPKDDVYSRNTLDVMSENLATDLIQKRIKEVINGSK